MLWSELDPLFPLSAKAKVKADAVIIVTISAEMSTWEKMRFRLKVFRCDLYVSFIFISSFHYGGTWLIAFVLLFMV